jgi:phosphohistidine phosphatase
MRIYLVQHGKNVPKEQDPDKPLSEEGAKDVRRIADVARNYGLQVARIYHSGKLRARQSAEIYAELLTPAGGLREAEGLSATDDVTAFTTKLEDGAMFVGHLPFMERMVGYLTAGSPDNRVLKFQNGCLVCLFQEDGQWLVKWTLMPNID